MNQTQTEKPVVKGPVDGNIFVILGAASTALKRAGQRDRAKEMTSAVTQAESYDQALGIVLRYVEFDI